MTALLEVQNLRVSFPEPGGGRITPVDGVTFTLERGRTLALVGESGCGKSLTSLAILRLVSPPGRIDDGSSIRLGETDLLALRGEALRRVRGRRIAMIFQDPMTSLNPVFTVESQITEVVHAHFDVPKREARDRAAALLQEVGIPDPLARLKAYPHQLSGGMRQRVMIAIALACDPQLLIADEPTTALDVTIQAQILDLMRSAVVERDTALILITHDLGVVAGMAQRINVMYAGHVVERAETDELYGRPRHPYTVGLLQSIPRLDAQGRGELVPIQGQPPDLSRQIGGCPFAPRCFNVQERCRQENPALEQAPDAADGHEVACWYPAEGETLVPSGFEAERAS